MSPPSIHSNVFRDVRWVIKTFRPLLKLLDVQNIPPPPDLTVVSMENKREWVIQGMGRCSVAIEQEDLSAGRKGLLLTHYDAELDYFSLQILINRNLCQTNSFDVRVERKLTAVHEFTHAVAAISAISRIKSEHIRKKLIKKLREKANDDVKQIIEVSGQTPDRRRYQDDEDEHFRLGFEYFPVSYPVILDEFLFSKEMFEEFFNKEEIQTMCRLCFDKKKDDLMAIVLPRSQTISQKKALDEKFVRARIGKILNPFYSEFARKPR